MVDWWVQSAAEILFLDELWVLLHEVAFCVKFTVTSGCELPAPLFFVGASCRRLCAAFRPAYYAEPSLITVASRSRNSGMM